MSIFYVDSSVLVKRHIQETGSDWFRKLCVAVPENLIVTAHISLAEVYSALNRRRREGSLSKQNYNEIANDFSAICQNQYQIVQISDVIIEEARRVLENHPLRAYDAIQLASGILAEQILKDAGTSQLMFLSADNRLLDAARAEELAVGNPNNYH